jgi:hypothetical protein
MRFCISLALFVVLLTGCGSDAPTPPPNLRQTYRLAPHHRHPRPQTRAQLFQSRQRPLSSSVFGGLTKRVSRR